MSDEAMPLPCPFCGATDISHNDGIAIQDYSCNVCGAVGPDGQQNSGDALSRWNNRSDLVPRWVSVEDSIPPEGETVLLRYASGIVVSGRFRRGHDDGEPQPYITNYRADCCGRFATPTDWMSIP